jgi:hypothetical protein
MLVEQDPKQACGLYDHLNENIDVPLHGLLDGWQAIYMVTKPLGSEFFLDQSYEISKPPP